MAPSLETKTLRESSHTMGCYSKSGGLEVRAWDQPGPAVCDFRSEFSIFELTVPHTNFSIGDVVTTATPEMLEAISKAGLDDGWSGSGAVAFEKYIAFFASREAAMFMISSTWEIRLQYQPI